ncbi:MAG: phenylacetate--CoA ligase family protein [Cyclobacteriaceae bacterium]|nr:phenylacetate--CoA ligase family protein [Cyclobacteriaceae bacterium]
MVYSLFLERVLLPVGDWLLGTRYVAALREWRAIQHLTEEELNALQRQKLRRVILHALNNVARYRGFHNLLESGEGDIEKVLKALPIVTKSEINSNPKDFLWHPEKIHELICEKSSGSSGVQGAVYMSKREQSNVMAIQTLFWEWAGYRLGMKMVQTGMTLNRGWKKSLKDFFLRVKYWSAFGLAPGEVRNNLEKVRGKGYRTLGGYASSLYVVAKTACENQVMDIHLDSVVSWGDKLFPHYRAELAKVFHAKVYDTYGTTEGFMMAAQKDLDSYYIMSPHVYLEFLTASGEPVRDGEIGHIVVTSLDAFEMPLIRFYLGDLGIRLPRSEYPPKRDLQFPLLKQIIGRDTDIVMTPSGKSMIVHFFTAIFEHIPEIRQFRVVQENISAMRIEFIPGIDFTPSVLVQVKEKIDHHLGENFPIEFCEVSSIPATPSGKPQIVLSKLDKSLYGN